MSQTKSFENMTEKLSKQVMNNAQGREMLGRQTERFWRAENDMVSEIEDYLNGWCKRRHDAAKAAMNFGHLLTNSADQTEVIEAWGDLSSRAMTRLSEDAEAQMTLLQNMAFKLMPHTLAFSAPDKAAEPAVMKTEKKAAGAKDAAAREVNPKEAAAL